MSLTLLTDREGRRVHLPHFFLLDLEACDIHERNLAGFIGSCQQVKIGVRPRVATYDRAEQREANDPGSLKIRFVRAQCGEDAITVHGPIFAPSNHGVKPRLSLQKHDDTSRLYPTLKRRDTSFLT